MNKPRSKPFNLTLAFVFVFSFLIWIVCFWEFLSGKLALTSDAISYYNHIKFFTENLAKGVYPLWDPNWHFGSPNEFFLRRIGSFNPLYFVIVLLIKLKVPFFQSYMMFFAGYYFLGCIGFYVCAVKVLKKKPGAFAAYLLLLFSSLGTRIFDSFIILEFVPLMWFFAFMVLFFGKKEKLGALGMVFCAMILLTTYIPFYFLNIVSIFVLCFAVFYTRKFFRHLKRVVRFFGKNKMFTALCMMALIVSLIPGIKLYQQTSAGEIALSKRHAESKEESMVAVGKKTITEWGIEEDLFYSYSFRDLKKFKFAIFYIPVFFYLICALGIFARLNKRLIFLFSWLLVLLITFSPYTPVYHFLHKHIFYFKYFRNLHFYLWWAVLPVMILFCGELLRQVLEYRRPRKVQNILSYLFISAVHLAALKLTQQYHFGANTTYLVIILSGLFFLTVQPSGFNLLKPLRRFILNRKTVYWVLLLLVSIQPLELYSNLVNNSGQPAIQYQYDKPYFDFTYTRESLMSRPEGALPRRKEGSFHYALKSYEDLAKEVDNNILYDYLAHKFLFTDSIELVEQKEFDHKLWEENLRDGKNIVYVSKDNFSIDFLKGLKNLFTSEDADPIANKTKRIDVIDFNANSIRFKTDLERDKFLVYNDNYHSSWNVFINGARADLFRANYGFKGIWIPKGKNEVRLHFGSLLDHGLNLLLLAVFYFIFIKLILTALSGRKEQKDKKPA